MRIVIALLCLGAEAVSAQARYDTVVKYLGAPRHAGVASLVRELTIGGDAADPDYQFDKITHMAVARDGMIWVVENSRGASGGGCTPGPCGTFGTNSVRVYSPAGKLMRAAGRTGMGPGEWQFPCGVRPLPDSRVLLDDCSLINRWTFYQSNGLLDTTWTLPTRTSIVGIDTAGNFWIYMMEGAPQRAERGFTWTQVGVRLNSRGSVIDTFVAPPRLILPRAPSVMGSENGKNGVEVSAPYNPRSLYQPWSPRGYFASGVAARYAIDLHLPRQSAPGKPSAWHEGDPITSLRRNSTLLAVTEEERRAQRTYMEDMVTYFGGTRDGPIPPVPHTKPALTGASFDLDGRIWVGVSVPSEHYNPPPSAFPARNGRRHPVIAWREPLAFDVLEPDGSYIGRVVLPYGRKFAGAPVSRGDLIWLVVADDDGIESVVRYRIVWR